MTKARHGAHVATLSQCMSPTRILLLLAITSCTETVGGGQEEPSPRSVNPVDTKLMSATWRGAQVAIHGAAHSVQDSTTEFHVTNLSTWAPMVSGHVTEDGAFSIAIAAQPNDRLRFHVEHLAFGLLAADLVVASDETIRARPSCFGTETIVDARRLNATSAMQSINLTNRCKQQISVSAIETVRDDHNVRAVDFQPQQLGHNDTLTLSIELSHIHAITDDYLVLTDQNDTTVVSVFASP